MITASMARTWFNLRFNVEGSGVADGVPVGWVVGVEVGVSVGVGDGVGDCVGDVVVVDVVTVAKESRVVWSMGNDVLGSLSTGG